MATIGHTYPQLIDMYKGNAEGTVIELLRQRNDILEDAIATQCNLGTIHRHTIRTGYPTVTWGMLYKGVPASKSTLAQVDETTGFIEARSEIDERLLDLAPDPAKQRLVDSAPFLESLSLEMATGLFYHDTATSPEKIKGLAARFSAYNTNPFNPAKSHIANQVIHGGGSNNTNTSIWFVTWADHAVSLLYPQNTRAGIKVIDRGREPVKDGDGDTYYAKVTTFEWHVGLSVKDYRYCARIANIDINAVRAGTVDLWALMRKAYYRLHRTFDVGAPGGRTVIYMNREVLEALHAQSTDRALVSSGGSYNYSAPGLSQAQVEGRVVRTYMDIPIRICDAILNNEANVPGIAV